MENVIVLFIDKVDCVLFVVKDIVYENNIVNIICIWYLFIIILIFIIVILNDRGF